MPTLEYSAGTKITPHPQVDADHQLVDPRLAGVRRLMIKIPETPPCYLTSNDLEESHPAAFPQMLPLKTLP